MTNQIDSDLLNTVLQLLTSEGSSGFAEGLPVGLQLIGPALGDVRLLEVGHAFQQITPHHRSTPSLVL